MKKTRLLALILALLVVLSSLAGCGPKKPAVVDGDEPDVPVEKIYRTYLDMECPMLNGHDSVESVLQTPHNYCSSPLFRAVPTADGKGYEYVGDLAAELPIQIDENTWQIKIREDAHWNDEAKTPINADTFMYSFKMQLDPILVNKMMDFLADYTITIVNAAEYARQGTSNTISWDDVGIKKLDDYTLEIKTVTPKTLTDFCHHFTDRSTFPVYEPYYEAGMNEARTETNYGTTLDNWMGCGPYFFETWEYGNIHVYKKNPDHWLADLFKYDTVEVRIIPEMNARVQLWEQGMLDDLSPDANTIDTYIDDPRMVSYPSLGVRHIDVNCKNPNNPISGTLAYRKALYHALDREVIARDIFGHMVPTGTYVNGMAGISSESKLTYRESAQGKAVAAMVEEWGPYGYNPELARQYLAEAYAEAGIPEDTVVNVIMAVESDSTAWLATAEFLMEEWPVIFEGKINLELVTYAGMSATDWKKTGDDKWDLSPNNWTRGVSRTLPFTCFYYYLSTYSSHPNNYFSDRFEAQYAVCDSAEVKADYNRVLDETKKLEEIYLEDVIHIPVLQVVNYAMFSDRLKLPVSTYIPGFGWGTMYGDIIGE